MFTTLVSRSKIVRQSFAHLAPNFKQEYGKGDTQRASHQVRDQREAHEVTTTLAKARSGHGMSERNFPRRCENKSISCINGGWRGGGKNNVEPAIGGTTADSKAITEHRQLINKSGT